MCSEVLSPGSRVGFLRHIRFRLSPKHGEVYRAYPCAQHLWSASQNQKTAHTHPPPTPGVLAGNIRTLTPALCTALKETGGPDSRRNGGDHTQQVRAELLWVAQSSGPSQAAQAGLATPPTRPQALLLPRVELIRTSASQPTPCHLLIYVSSL